MIAMKTLVLLLNILSILVDSGQGKGVAGRGAGSWSGEDIGRSDKYMECHGLDVIKEKECIKKVDEDWFNWWLLIGPAAFALLLGLCW